MRPTSRVSITEDSADEELPLSVAGDHVRLTGLYRYWEAKRGERKMPARRDLRPEEMREFLGYLVLVDVEAGSPSKFRFRLVGAEIAGAYGRDMTGLYVDDVLPLSYRNLLLRHYGRATEVARPILHRVKFMEWTGKTHELIRLILPLSEDNQTVNMLVMASVFGDELKKDGRPTGSSQTSGQP
jgi:hypothetical protein